jgi:tetraacyldisaccharide-1-P 4'-kinase
MTEKDAVKLRSYARELDDAWVLTQRLEWDWGEAAIRTLLSKLPSPTETPSLEAEP